MDLIPLLWICATLMFEQLRICFILTCLAFHSISDQINVNFYCITSNFYFFNATHSFFNFNFEDTLLYQISILLLLLCYIVLNFYFIVVKTLNMRSTLLTDFQVYNIGFLTTGTILYSRSLEPIHLP